MKTERAASPRVVYVEGMPFSVKPETAIRMLISNMARYINHETIALTDVGSGKLNIPAPPADVRSPLRELVAGHADPGFLSTFSVMRLLSNGDGCAV